MTQHDTTENVRKNADFDDATQNSANSFFKARDWQVNDDEWFLFHFSAFISQSVAFAPEICMFCVDPFKSAFFLILCVQTSTMETLRNQLKL